MPKDLRSLLWLCLVLTPSLACSVQQPIVNLNQVTAIREDGGGIVFETPNGTKSFDLRLGRWSYNLNKGAAFPGQSVGGETEPNELDIAAPDWAQQEAYFSVVAKFPASDPKFLLTSSAGEGAITDRYDVVDIAARTSYEIPPIDATSILVNGNLIWVGTSWGIVSVDRKTGATLEYTTYPAFDRINAAAEVAGRKYYLSESYGLQEVDPAARRIRVVAELSRYAFPRYKFSDMLAVGSRLLILVTPMERTGQFVENGTALVLWFDPSKGVIDRRSDTQIRYASRLRMRGDRVVGYGRWIEQYEGGVMSNFRV